MFKKDDTALSVPLKKNKEMYKLNEKAENCCHYVKKVTF